MEFCATGSTSRTSAGSGVLLALRVVTCDVPDLVLTELGAFLLDKGDSLLRTELIVLGEDVCFVLAEDSDALFLADNVA